MCSLIQFYVVARVLHTSVSKRLLASMQTISRKQRITLKSTVLTTGCIFFIALTKCLTAVQSNTDVRIGQDFVTQLGFIKQVSESESLATE